MCCVSKTVMQRGVISICILQSWKKKCSLLIVPDAVITYKYMYVYVHLNEENYLWKQAII